MKSNRNLFLTVALVSGMIGIAGCSSTSTNTVSAGNTGGNGTSVVNKTMNAPAVENVNANSMNAPVQNSSVKPSNATVDMRRPMATDENSLSDSAVGGKIGVPECDEYLTKYEACLRTKVPESERGALLSPFEKQRKGWQIAATNQAAKAALPGGCKVALATAKDTLAKYSCEW